jgi:hypothetical protein
VEAIFLSWVGSAVVIILLAVFLGYRVKVGAGPLGILVDDRGRFSLTHLQLVAWTAVILSLVCGVCLGRWFDGLADPLGFSIPSQVLGLLGVAAGSAVVASGVKSTKDTTAPKQVAASNQVDKPRLEQIFLAEEGAFADKVIDVAKFQGFIVTVVLIIAYVGLAIQTINDAGSVEKLTALPAFSATFLTLLGISQGTYVLGKIPGRQGEPEGLTVARRKSDPNLTAVGVKARNPS